ncbi:hypothetical protein H109_06108 [Trichophyton interdigitale MR816]|uniref:Uncharacterized protein n=1 Tax=Trichophyton interdigitale (strain MR816) TaxID=1215338 RepID=A0A059J2R1_TRIIM|nr:hypothetical protein H109_06108 [Trichophyton interdigitale MR816]
MARCFSELKSKAEDNRLSTKKTTKSIRNPNLETEVGRSEKGGPRGRVLGGSKWMQVSIKKNTEREPNQPGNDLILERNLELSRGTIEVAVQKRITGNFQIPMQVAYWLDEFCAERRHRWNFRDRPNGNKEDAEAQKPVDTSQWAHSGLNGCLMHVHENRARHAKDVRLRLRLSTLTSTSTTNKREGNKKIADNKLFSALTCFMLPSACLSAALPCGNRFGACLRPDMELLTAKSLDRTSRIALPPESYGVVAVRSPQNEGEETGDISLLLNLKFSQHELHRLTLDSLRI